MDAQKLIGVLEQQSSVYQILVDLSKSMQEAIIVNNIAKIDSLIKMQMALVMKLSSLERRRTSIAKEISNKVSLDGNNLTISEVKKHLEDGQFDHLSKLEDQLTNNISKLSEINETNKLLINNGLDLIEFSLETLGVSGNSTYNLKGKNVRSQIVDEKV